VAAGPPEAVAADPASYTGGFLRQMLGVESMEREPVGVRA